MLGEIPVTYGLYKAMEGFESWFLGSDHEKELASKRMISSSI